MPQTIDVVVWNEMVERAKAGDCVVLTGSLVVVPDGSALVWTGNAARVTASTSNFRAGRDTATGDGGGIYGLAALGVQELTYRTYFVICCVLPSNMAEHVQRRGKESILRDDGHVIESWLFSMGADTGDSPKTAQEVVMKFAEKEKEEIRMMKGMLTLSGKVRLSWAI